MTTEITNKPLPLQTNLGDALIAISTAFDQRGIDAARTVAGAALDTAYGYSSGPFCLPTLANGEQTFRTIPTALAYFVGHSDDYPMMGVSTKAGDLSFKTAGYLTAKSPCGWAAWPSLTKRTVLNVDKSWLKIDKQYLRIACIILRCPISQNEF